MTKINQRFNLLKVRPKAQQGGEINPATSVNPDRALCARPGSLRWLNFPIPVGLVRGWFYVREGFLGSIEPDFNDLPEEDIPICEPFEDRAPIILLDEFEKEDDWPEEPEHECEDGCPRCWEREREEPERPEEWEEVDHE